VDFSKNDRFIRQDRFRKSGEARRIDMFPKQLDESPADDRTTECECSEQESYRGGPVIPRHSVCPQDKCAKRDAKN
jgi:hypothetical protein